MPDPTDEEIRARWDGIERRTELRGWGLTRRIDLGQIAALLLVFIAGISAIGAVYASLSSRQDALQTMVINAGSANQLLAQRIDQLDRSIVDVRNQMERNAADNRDFNKSFSAEVRSNLQQLTQSLADVRTLVAAQGNGRH